MKKQCSPHLCLFAILFFSIPGMIFANCRYLGNDRRSSFPFISGDTFRAYCNWIMDETGTNFIPEQVKEGDAIFVRTDMLPTFISAIHPHISNGYILVTHNDDLPIPGPSANLLEDEKLIAWFGQNVEHEGHPKLHPVPIGIANRYWSHGDIGVISQMQERVGKENRPYWLYMNFLIRTYPAERSYVYETFINRPYCVTKESVDTYVYLDDLIKSKFVLSPRGNGIDCHRTWEALLMGAIPIIKSSSLDPLYQDLPVLIVNSWDEITNEKLEKEWERIQAGSYKLEKLYAGYWLDLISSYQGNR